ncbi:hypothetical protein [Longimicrobium terrae]|uniref:FlgD Ig-like domain-containing protein n=2 Tax=Longimicrobium terrae TaxID=1639882 RepID=A0A841GXA5_9BACT|nr:hypothetical protein [Longimicrobium terrae]MBB4635343.1 hypothetical protein [Longimicrobium terrae]MBB6069736.1 hypothetical protein [Longimicrobium terrae]NNC31053.1 hypothetical protein [Longimicrobium terrae]
MNSEVLMLRAPPVLLLLLLLFGSLPAPPARAQSGTQAAPQAKGFRLEQNYPNPANPDTYIPFVLEDAMFADGGTRVVSMRIVNMFGQLVATPRAVGHPRGRNVPVLNLRYTEPGQKVAYWDGRDTNGNPVATGVYVCMLQVDNRTVYDRVMVTAPPKRRSRFWPFGRRGN